MSNVNALFDEVTTRLLNARDGNYSAKCLMDAFLTIKSYRPKDDALLLAFAAICKELLPDIEAELAGISNNTDSLLRSE